MLSLNQQTFPQPRPREVVVIAMLLLLQAGVSVVFAALLLIGPVSLSTGALLLGGGLEQLGPVVFLLQGAVAALLALGLWKGWRWSRLAAVAYCAAGVLMAVPATSSAVVDARVLAIVREGLQIMARVVVIYYLAQEPVKEWFAT